MRISDWSSDVCSSDLVWTFGPDTGGFNAYSGTWGGVVLNSGQRVVQGYILAVLIAVPFGILIGWSSVVARLIDPTIQSLRPIPITAWLPFSIAMFGIKDYGEIGRASCRERVCQYV